MSSLLTVHLQSSRVAPARSMSLRVLMDSVFLITIYVTLSTTVGMAQMRTTTSAVRYFSVCKQEMSPNVNFGVLINFKQETFCLRKQMFKINELK